MDINIVEEYKLKYPTIYEQMNDSFFDFFLNNTQFVAEYINEYDDNNEYRDLVKIFYDGIPFLVFLHDSYDVFPSGNVTNYYVFILDTIHSSISLEDIPELLNIAIFIFQMKCKKWSPRHRINLIINDILEYNPDCAVNVIVHMDEIMNYISQHIKYRDVTPE